MPDEGYISAICQEFGCDPDRAVELNAPRVSKVLEFRTAVRAKDQFNRKASDMSKAEVEIYTEMVKAVQEMNMAEDVEAHANNR